MVVLYSLVYEISSGKIVDSSVNARLNCCDASGWIAGFAGYMPYNENKFGTISHCISNVSFSGVGAKHLDIVQSGLMKKTRTTGTITNCVISLDAKVDGVIISEYSKAFLIFGTASPASKSNYIVASSTEMQDFATYANTKTCDFDIESGDGNSKWLYFNNTRLPAPRAIMKAFENIAG